MKDKRLTVMVVLFLLVASIGVIGLAYSYLLPTVQGNGSPNLLESGDLSLQFSDNTSISRGEIIPGDFVVKTFTVRNTGSGDTDYSIGWKELEYNFINDEIQLRFTCKRYTTYLGAGNAGNVEDGTCNGADYQPAGDLNFSFLSNTIEMNVTHEYEVTLLFIETEESQNYNRNKNFYGKLDIVAGDINTWADACVPGDTSLRCKIVTDNTPYPDNKKSPFVTNGSGIDFANISSNYWTDSIQLNKSISLTSNGNVAIATGYTAVSLNKTIDLTGYTVGTTYNSTDVGKYTCGDNTTTCTTMYKILEVTGSTVTKVDIYTRDRGAENLTSNGYGVYYTANKSKTDGGKRVYYYRGAVENNYVLFAGYCWRIVRTTEDGSVKLLYGGEPTDGACPTTGTAVSIGTSQFNTRGDDNRYAGYMYGSETGAISSSTSTLTLDSTYYYSNSYTMSGTNFVLNGDMINADWNTNDTCTSAFCPVQGYYTCKATTANATCATLYKIESFASTTTANAYTITSASNEYANAHENINNSTIKNVVDLWYASNIENKGTSVTSLIADVPYCNDRSIDSRNITSVLGYSSNATDYATKTRLGTYNDPTYKCVNNNDKFTVTDYKGNGDLTYAIGLITADELVYAGANNNTPNSEFYAFSRNYYCTMSPYGFSSSGYVFFLNYGNLSDNDTNVSCAVRPAISLNSSARVASGNGKYNTPYVIN